MSDESVELAEQLAEWEMQEILEAYTKMGLQNPYALVGSSLEDLFPGYMQLPIDELRKLYRIKVYQRAARKEQEK